MDLLGICISTGSACNSQDTEISHVLKAIDLNDEYAKGIIRVSLGKYNTSEDVEKIVRGLEKILGSTFYYLPIFTSTHILEDRPDATSQQNLF